MWTNLRNKILSKTSQTQKATDCMIPFIRGHINRIWKYPEYEIGKSIKQTGDWLGLGVGERGGVAV